MATRPDVLIIPGISMMLAAKKLAEEKKEEQEKNEEQERILRNRDLPREE